MTQKRFLLAASTSLAQEALTVFCTRLVAEGHSVAVLGPTNVVLPEEVLRLSRLVDVTDYQPNVIIPLDQQAAVGARELFKGMKARHLHKDPLAYQVAQSRSFGLSLIAKTGMPVIPYHVVTNEGDRMRLEAKMHESGQQWNLYEDNPDYQALSDQGALALPPMEGESITVAYLLSGRNIISPAFVYCPMLGLLAKGGLKDWRGCVVIPTWNNKLQFIGNKVQQAMSAIGASGFVFVSLLFPPGKRKAMVTNISLQPPRGFLAAVFLSGMTGFGVGDALHQVAGNKEFYLRTEMLKPAFAFLVTDQRTQEPDYPAGPDWLGFPTPGYAQGYYVSDSPEIPNELWEIRPTAEIKLDGQGTLDYALQRLEHYRLLPDGNVQPSTELPEPELEEELEEVLLEEHRKQVEPVEHNFQQIEEEFGDDLTEHELALLAQNNTGGGE